MVYTICGISYAYKEIFWGHPWLSSKAELDNLSEEFENSKMEIESQHENISNKVQDLIFSAGQIDSLSEAIELISGYCDGIVLHGDKLSEFNTGSLSKLGLFLPADC